MSVGTILTLIAVVLFAVEAFGGRIGSLHLLPLGLAFFAAGHIA